MTFAERVQAVAKKGFTDRQAGFLVTVMLHSGVCISQHRAYARIVRGQKVFDFFASLVAKRFATSHPRCASSRPHLPRAQQTALCGDWRAKRSQPQARHARPRRGRLMLLDSVLAERRLRWLGSEGEGGVLQGSNDLRLKELPHLAFGRGAEKTIRHFPDKLPIGVAGDGRTHVFVLPRQPADACGLPCLPAPSRRAAESLARVGASFCWCRATWEGGASYEEATREELSRPLRLDDAAELRWYFFRQQDQVDRGDAPDDFKRFRRACRTFRGPRYHVLYRLWKKGDEPVNATVSPVLEDKIARRRGHVTSQVLSHVYAHLTPLVGSA